MLFTRLGGGAALDMPGAWDAKTDAAIGGADYGKAIDPSIYDSIKGGIARSSSCPCGTSSSLSHPLDQASHQEPMSKTQTSARACCDCREPVCIRDELL
jgi:hypothetical protein